MDKRAKSKGRRDVSEAKKGVVQLKQKIRRMSASRGHILAAIEKIIDSPQYTRYVFKDFNIGEPQE